MPANEKLNRSPLTIAAAALAVLPLSTYPATDSDPASSSNSTIQSIRTDLSAASCRKEIDKSDPDEIAYQVCPGVAGYTLIVRHVDSGRRSIDIVDPSQRRFPLNYQEFVTRYMSSLVGKAEWRIATKSGKRVPIALIVRVQAREENDNPARVTRTYLALAKITPNEVCVTDRIPEGMRSDAEVHYAADSARSRPCAAPQPQMTSDGAVIR